MAAEVWAPVMCHLLSAPRPFLGFRDVQPCLPRRDPFLDTSRLAGFLNEVLHDMTSEDSDMESDDAECCCPNGEEECAGKCDEAAGKSSEINQDCGTCNCEGDWVNRNDCHCENELEDTTDEPTCGISAESSTRDVNVHMQESPGKFQVQFNLSGFAPPEISVKTKDDKYLEIHAKHQETLDDGHVFQEFHQVLSLPSHVDAQSIKSALTTDGQLTVKASVKRDTTKTAIEQDSTKTLEITHE